MTTSTPFRNLLHAANLRCGTDGFTSPPKEGVLRIFFALKIPTASAGFEPANLGTKGQHATPTPPKPQLLFMKQKIAWSSAHCSNRINHWCLFTVNDHHTNFEWRWKIWRPEWKTKWAYLEKISKFILYRRNFKLSCISISKFRVFGVAGVRFQAVGQSFFFFALTSERLWATLME